jgi:hypothetical protein
MNINPKQFIQLIRNGGNPQQLMMNLLSQMQGTPMGNNLLSMAQANDTKGIEQLARNLCQQRGVDFDQEFSNFKQMLGLR